MKKELETKEKITMPEPFSTNWRNAYRHEETDLPRLSAYQAPDGSPVPFIFDTVSVSGGQSVDTAEYPFHGLWSNNSLNEKPHSIKIGGFLRGLDYIENRTKLLGALRVQSSDDKPGFLELPLWGRFPVVVLEWSIDESGKANGQCAVSFTFTRAGISEEERGTSGGQTTTDSGSAGEAFKETATQSFTEALKKQVERNTLLSAFDNFKKELLNITGRIQGAQNFLNKITNEVQNISNLIAQGITAPRTLAEALFGAVASIAGSIATIKNAIEQPFPVGLTRDNAKNALMQFLTAASFALPGEPLTEAERVTKEQSENLYKSCALYAAAQLLPELENTTYQQQQSLWVLFEQLEQSIKKDDAALYTAIDDVRIALSQTLIAKKVAAELSTQIQSPMPLLALAQYLGCDATRIRYLNRIENSFVIEGAVKYV